MPITHVVSSGETLSRIAARYSTTVERIQAANEIANPNLIYPDQKLVIPDRFDDRPVPRGPDLNGGVSNTAPVTTELITARNREAILKAARSRVDNYGPSYGTAAAAVSSNPKLPGNEEPNETKLSYYEGKWKCNLFVGDVLSDAGLRAPKLSGGWYDLSQVWHERSDLFTKIDPSDAKPGDLLVIDRRRPDGSTDDPEGAGHAVVLTSAISEDGDYQCIAAKYDGAYEHSRNMRSDAGVYGDGDLSSGSNKVYVLRPKVGGG